MSTSQERIAGALGKLPATDFDAGNVLFKMVQAAPLPAAPPSFGADTLFTDWGMLGNDSVGDCAFAGSGHEHMCWTAISAGVQNAAQFSAAGVISAYSGLTGYKPGETATDRGTNVSQLMDYRRQVGIPDITGTLHKIDLAVRLEPVSGPFDWAQFVSAVNAFKCVAVGTLMPASAMQQFNAGQPWSYIGDHNIEGGHYIPAVGSPKSDSEVAIITWGRRQIMTRDFFEAYVDELWIPLSQEAMASIDLALSVVDWDAVQTIARGLGQADA